MFELVRDVRRYPEFIKWIESLSVSQESQDKTIYTCLGQASVRFRSVAETFATHVESDSDKRRIEVRLASGPFRHLRNRWQFDDRGDGHTRIHFFIDYEFRNPVLSLLARSNSGLAVRRIMSAFRQEADRRYARTA